MWAPYPVIDALMEDVWKHTQVATWMKGVFAQNPLLRGMDHAPPATAFPTPNDAAAENIAGLVARGPLENSQR